jgi:hypothetical protein
MMRAQLSIKRLMRIPLTAFQPRPRGHHFIDWDLTDVSSGMRSETKEVGLRHCERVLDHGHWPIHNSI